jgi:SAM-dependent methyltransferase
MKSLIRFLLNRIPRPWLITCSYAFAPVASIWFRGDKYTDPIDGKSYRRFLPYGYGTSRENALAPGTLSLERHRLIWLYLLRDTDFFTKRLTVLSIAPEQCFLKRFKNLPNLDYITADLDSPIADVQADVLDLPFGDNEFDVVFCNHVLEHVPNDAQAMAELYRVMKPGGWGICQVPLDYALEVTYENSSITDKRARKQHFGQYDHVRRYGVDYFARLADAGFEVEQVKYCETLGEKAVERYALSDEEILPVVRKSSIRR